MNNEPVVSVIIPIYNTGKYLYKCLDTIIGQTWKNLEIILIDDGSSDGSYDVCRQYADKDVRIKLFRQENKGVSSARNYGISVASGDYYSFIDSDDYLELDAYEYLLGLVEKTNAEAVTFEYFLTRGGSDVPHRFSDRHYGLFDRHETLRQQLYDGNDFACTKLFPKKSLDGLLFHEDVYRDEDSLFTMQALAKLDKVFYDSRPLLHYVQSEDSACRGVFRPSQLSAVKVFPIVTDFLTKEYPDLYVPWLITRQQLLITLYYDMYFDKADYRKEMKGFHRRFWRLYISTFFTLKMTLKNRVKFFLFAFSPKILCFLHKKWFKL